MLSFHLLLWIEPFPGRCSDLVVEWQVSSTETAKAIIYFTVNMSKPLCPFCLEAVKT